jgi:hypothetical protein
MAVLAQLNKHRCQEVARMEGLSLGEAADHLVELGWHSYSDRHVDAVHSNRKLGRELRRIRKQRDDLLHRSTKRVAA